MLALIDSQLIFPWKSIGIGLDITWHPIGSQLAANWASDLISIGIQYDLKWHSIDCQLASDWISIALRLDLNCHLIRS